MKVNFLDKKDQIEKYFEENEDYFYSNDHDCLFDIFDNELYFTLENHSYSINENFVVTIPIKTAYKRNEYNSEIIMTIAKLLNFLGELFGIGGTNVSI